MVDELKSGQDRSKKFSRAGNLNRYFNAFEADYGKTGMYPNPEDFNLTKEQRVIVKEFISKSAKQGKMRPPKKDQKTAGEYDKGNREERKNDLDKLLGD